MVVLVALLSICAGSNGAEIEVLDLRTAPEPALSPDLPDPVVTAEGTLLPAPLDLAVWDLLERMPRVQQAQLDGLERVLRVECAESLKVQRATLAAAQVRSATESMPGWPWWQVTLAVVGGVLLGGLAGYALGVFSGAT